jgi:predicted nucleic acid-binding protein
MSPDPGIVSWLDSAVESSLYLSVFTLGEVRKGIEGLHPGKRRHQLERWLQTDLRQRFEGRILPVDLEIADQWGKHCVTT